MGKGHLGYQDIGGSFTSKLKNTKIIYYKNFTGIC